MEEKKKSHRGLKIVGIVLLIFIVLAVIGSASQTKEGVNNANPTTGNQAPAEPEQPKFDIATFYPKVETGMTKAQVTELAGKPSDGCTESETAGFGKYEICNWNGSFTSGQFATVSFKDGLVESKSKTGF